MIEQQYTSHAQPGIKVIGFDSWTGGSHHFERLLEAFGNKGIELTLIHLGSWGGDMGRAAEERIGQLRVRDISSYPKSSFPAIIELERPSAVIFLSTHTFAHRAFNRYCRQRKLPTINLFHGLIAVQAINTSAVYKVNLLAQLRFISSRVLKAFTYVWPSYAMSLWRTGARPKEWIKFARDIFTLTSGKYILVAADDARTDVCCVYVNADVDFAVKKYGFARDNIVTVGNPDLIRFGLSEHLIGMHLGASSADNGSDVMYVDTGLIYTGSVFTSEKEFIQHLVDTRKMLEVQGRHLIFKPHPDHLRTNISSLLVDAGIDICSTEDFVARLERCCASIVEPSTAAVVPALMGMPLFLANYGRLREQRYGEVLASYPRAKILRDVNDFNALIAAEQTEHDPAQTSRWIEANAGPLPAESMPDRVASVILKLVNTNTENRQDSISSKSADANINCSPFFQPGTLS